MIPEISMLGGTHRPSVAGVAMAGAPGKAAANLGEDIGRSTSTLVDIHQRYQRARDNGAKNSARLMIQQAQAEHAQFRMQNPDESLWQADIDARMGKARETIFGQEMSPFMREEMDATFAGWQQDARNATMLDATKQGVARARQKSTNAARAYKAAGDFESARRVVAESRDSGVWLPEEAEADLIDIDDEEREFQKKKKAEEFAFAADTDPITVLEILNAKDEAGNYANDTDLEPGQRFRLIKHAEASLEAAKRDEFDAIEGGISEGRVTEAEIDTLPQFLGDREKRALKSHFNRVTPPTEEEYLQSWKRLEGLRAAYRDGEVPEADYLKAYRETRADILATVPPDYQGDLRQSLAYLSPANRSKPGAPENFKRDAKRELEMEAASTLTAAFDAGFFGKIDGTPQEKEQAARKFRDLKRGAAAWIEQQPGATVEDVRGHVDGLLSGQRAGAAAGSLRSFIPGSGASMLPPVQSAGRQKSADAAANLSPGEAGASDALLPSLELDEFLQDGR
jgi:hypothetical protein